MIHCEGCGSLTHGIDGFCAGCLEAICGPRSLTDKAERIYLAQLDRETDGAVRTIVGALLRPAVKVEIGGPS